jgi:acetyl esterase/lipase
LTSSIKTEFDVPYSHDNPHIHSMDWFIPQSPNGCGFLFIHGDNDKIVPLAQSKKMDKKLRLAGVYSRLKVLPGVGHGFGYGIDSEVQKTSVICVEAFLKDIFHIDCSNCIRF